MAKGQFSIVLSKLEDFPDFSDSSHSLSKLGLLCPYDLTVMMLQGCFLWKAAESVSSTPRKDCAGDSSNHTSSLFCPMIASMSRPCNKQRFKTKSLDVRLCQVRLCLTLILMPP